MIKKYLFLFCLFSLNLAVFGRELPNFEQFTQILGKLESNNNDFALGDKGKALGRYQIWRVCYLDAKEYDKSITFSYESLTNKVNSDKVVKAYISRYCKENNFESWARLWNGGPNWKKKLNKTDLYWKKFVALAKIVNSP